MLPAKGARTSLLTEMIAEVPQEAAPMERLKRPLLLAFVS